MATTAGERPPEVAEGVYRLGTRWVNFYLVGEGGEFTLIDAGYPGYWRYLVGAIEALRTSPDAIRAVIVTHHHADHAGTAERLRSTGGTRVLAGEGDAWIVTGRYPSHASPGFYWQCSRHGSGLRFLAHSAAAGGARYRPVASVETVAAEQTLGLPGRPRLIRTPGHTAGHLSVALEDRGVLLTGDALANLDYVIGNPGLGLHRLNDDREVALGSLNRFDGVAADTVLFAHGEPWTDGLAPALQIVRERELA
jgi:glyoxylase-like metal-dependent hydrolase (beta-lactamase superfamily II)